MDQLASIGVEFDLASLDRCFRQSADFYRISDLEVQEVGLKRGVVERWAVDPIYRNNHPLRPWGLGAINKASGLLYKLSGQTVRTPGLYKPTDPETKLDKSRFLQDTNERIHSSVRIRLVCQGLGLDDKSVWDCPALLKNWRMKRTRESYDDPVPFHPGWDPAVDEDALGDPNHWSKGRWVWEYKGDDRSAPKDKKQQVLVEEPLGPYERYMLRITGGTPNVYHFADTRVADKEG